MGRHVTWSNPSALARRRVARARDVDPDENTRAHEALAAWMGGGGVVFLTRELLPKSGKATIRVHCDVHGDGEMEAPKVATFTRRALAMRNADAVLAW